jgi:surface antigen|tara:strand:- start:43 stop:492 length:450 start_codon:yes stop_codon:yes gene_type:complete
MFVKSLMARGKWLILLGSLLLTACGTTATTNKSISSQNSVSHNYTHAGTSVEIWYNFIRNNMGKLSKQDQKKQAQAVYFALDNLEEGKVVAWHTMKADTHGFVKVVASYPHGGGYCRVIFTQIKKKDKVRDFKETACKDVAYHGWQFIR